MSDGITDAASYDQRAFDDWKRREIKTFLSMRTTEELVDELCKRDGVTEYPVELEWLYSLHVMGKGHDIFTMNDGKKAARILVVTD